MTKRSLEFAMLLTADLAKAAADVKGLSELLTGVKAAGESAASGLQRVEDANLNTMTNGLQHYVAQQRSITAEVERRAKIEADAIARNNAATRQTIADYDRIAAKRADSIAAFSAATPEQLRTPQERTSAIGAEQTLRRDADVRMLEINRRADALEAKLAATRTGLTGATTRYTQAARASGKTAGETAQAMRQLPAQITDIGTSLASGMPIWLVAIQQGGQLKDSFGGTVPALRALAGAVSPMAIAVGVGAAAIGVLAVSAFQAYNEVQQLERSLISSGNIAGTTAGELAAVRDSVGGVAGAYGDAQTAVAGLAASGRVSAAALEDATSAAVSLAELEGRSIEDTTDQIIKLANAPSATLVELNQQYNFLSASVYEHVRALEAQGKETEAAEAAIEAFARVHEARVQEALEKAGSLEREWRALKGTISATWQEIKNIGRNDTEFKLGEQVKATVEATSTMRALLADPKADKQAVAFQRQWLDTQRERLDYLRKISTAETKNAEIQSARQEKQNAGVEASARIESRIESSLDREAKKTQALLKLRQDYEALRASNPDSARLNDGSYQQQVKAINEQFKAPKGEKPKKTDGQRANESAQREIDNLRQQVAMLDALEAGETRAAEAARIRYEIEKGAYREASPALKEQLLQNAQLLDSERQKVEVAKQLVDARMRAMQLQGRGDEASLQKTITQLEALRAKLIEVGDAAGAAEVSKLMGLERASSDLQGINRDFNAVSAQISNAEQRINIARESGLISSIEAQRQLIALRQQEIANIELLIPRMEAAAEAMDGVAKDEQIARIDALKTKLFELQAQGSLLETTFRNSFETGLANSLEGLATGTLTVREAVGGLIRDLIGGMARLAAQQLASLATAKLMAAISNRGGKGGAASGGAEADLGKGSDKLGVASLAASFAGLVIGQGAKQLQSASQELAQAAALLLLANSIGGFAEGGFTGPGEKYQVAGYVHKGEYVQPQARMREPGALDFMRDFHAQGMVAIDRWRGYADGGLVGASPGLIPSPRYTFAEGGLASGQLPAPQVTMKNINLIDSDALVGEYLRTPNGERAVLNIIGRNPRAVRGDG